jgi:hypothetical protein
VFARMLECRIDPRQRTCVIAIFVKRIGGREPMRNAFRLERRPALRARYGSATRQI